MVFLPVFCTAFLLLSLLGLIESTTTNDQAGASQQGECSPTNDDDTTCNAGRAPPMQGLTDPLVQQWISNLHTDSNYINGKWIKPSKARLAEQDDNANIKVIDPSTNKEIASVAVSSKEDVDTAVISARNALNHWSIETSLDKRRKLISRLLILYNENSEQMAQMISHEMGCPIDFSREAQVGAGSFAMEQFLYETSDDGGFEEWYELDDDTTIIHEAIGVVGLITPWNWPMNQIALKVIPALLVGCTVILKASEQTPLSALLFGDLIDKTGFPPGVFQLVNGYGKDDVGEWLASHPGIDMISFTGSTRAGKQVSNAAATNLKRVSLEMGGKGANIIFDDLIVDGHMQDFHDVIESGVNDVMSNSGQTCTAPTRMLVPAEHWEYALQVAEQTALEIQVASAHSTGDHIGPVVSQSQCNRIQQYIQSGIDQGATLLVGGLGKPHVKNDDSPEMQVLQWHYDNGFYVRPTIFVNCTPEMTIWQEEIFGPVLCMTPFRNEEEAIRLANASPYGLANYAHTYDKERRMRLSRRLQSGMVMMNHVGLAESAPFGGVKQSGNSREGGVWGLLDFTIVKAVSGLHSYDE